VQRLTGYPHWFYAALMGLLLSLFASGVCLLPTMLELRLELDTGLHLDGDLRLAGAALHTFASFIMVGVVGAMMTIHMRVGWRRRLNRFSGIALLAFCALLLLSAIGIFYAGDESISRDSSVIHAAAGLLAFPLYAWHAAKGRQLRRQGRHAH
jgi:hypothetical protein